MWAKYDESSFSVFQFLNGPTNASTKMKGGVENGSDGDNIALHGRNPSELVGKSLNARMLSHVIIQKSAQEGRFLFYFHRFAMAEFQRVSAKWSINYFKSR